MQVITQKSKNEFHFNKDFLCYYHFAMQAGFEPISKLGTGSFGVVFKARTYDSNSISALKFPSPRCEVNKNYKAKIAHIRRENHALYKALGIHGVPQLINYYKIKQDSRNSVALNREFIDGKVLSQTDTINDNDMQNRFLETVHELHRAGIAGLDLYQKSNIVLTPERPYIIDLGATYFRNEPDFELAKDNDLRLTEFVLFNKI